ncbi:Oxysterol-binding protein [Fasciola gigantica]|uniref:Oxysterol-binding protein n=1 Tax=Fasciola gigantica TaxID=46835 RepID=A0A504YJW4_FASGI|nr:Oxysterol-binding protein [Fasciola gigantica]
MEGPLSKWTNVVNGWQYRWFVLDFSVGILFYYTSKEKMIRGDRRGCVKLKNAQVGIDDEDDSTFTITVDHKTFHFQARDADERQKWLDALQEARDLHTQNYALLHQTNRLLEQPSSLSEFDRRIVEADAYLQILIDQQQELSLQNAETEEYRPETLMSISESLQSLIELVKKTIVCLQFARESMTASYSTVLTANQPPTAPVCDEPISAAFDSSDSVELGYDARLCASSPQTSSSMPVNSNSSSGTTTGPDTQNNARGFYSPVRRPAGRRGEGDGSLSPKQPSNREAGADFMRKCSTRSERRSLRARDCQLSMHSFTDSGTVEPISTSLPGNLSPSVPITLPGEQQNQYQLKLSPHRMPATSYSSSEDGHPFSVGDEDDDEFFDTQEDLVALTSPVGTEQSPGSGRYRPVQASCNNQQELLDNDQFDELYDDDDEEDLGSVQSQGSIITHLLSQLRIGMDLTRITLPTFILERRSTLEMYADFLAHADLWATIPDAPTPKDRMVSCLRWYLSAFHAGRRSSLAKKPYNPILGEIFRCYWCLNDSGDVKPDSSAVADDGLTERSSKLKELYHSGPVPWAPKNAVVFLAEQVSHHPPISAFYAEHVNQRIALDGHLWTKSKFLGLSIAVEMVGSAVISLLNLDEEYVVTFPCGYGRNILSVPWIELGGKTSIICAKSGYVTNIEFKTKPFYNGKKDVIHAEVLGPNEKKPFLVVDGEWNDKMWAKLWEQVTRNLKFGNLDAATDAKCRLEQRQRDQARYRQENKVSWIPEHFRGEGGNWIYRAPLIQRLFDPPNTTEVDESCTNEEVVPGPVDQPNSQSNGAY